MHTADRAVTAFGQRYAMRPCRDVHARLDPPRHPRLRGSVQPVRRRRAHYCADHHLPALRRNHFGQRTQPAAAAGGRPVPLRTLRLPPAGRADMHSAMLPHLSASTAMHPFPLSVSAPDQLAYRLLQDSDWARSAAAASAPPELRTLLAMILDSPEPRWIAWGQDE
ncbi:hypothetical protein G6F24_015648 [Rhizopus arrhizus]|nr:hypothetical protein G6F24_015648 [Rhizopus arrhizus]